MWQANRNLRGLVLSAPATALFSFIFLFVMAVVFAASGSAQKPEPKSAQQFVREVIQNEVKAEHDDSTLWRFRKITVKDGTKKLWDMIETKHGQVGRLLAVNGKPLSSARQGAERARLQRLLSHPDVQKRQAETQKADGDKETKLLQMLPDALLYHYAGKNGSVVKLTFTPNPKFHASDREAEVFHHMAGVMLLDDKAKRLVQLQGRLVSRVNFGLGILGHLDKGGTFEVKQADVASGHWDMTLLDTELTGKALFFKTISVRQKTLEFDYQRVPADISMEQAAQMLEKSKTESAAVTSKGSAGQ